MSFLGWVAAAGALFLLLALSSATIRRLPITTAAIYLGIGVGVGPIGLGWLSIDMSDAHPWILRLTEVAVVISLFIGGLRLRLPPGHAAWSAPLRLAGPVMIVCIAAIAAFAHLVLGLAIATALLVAAALAPTDPVLAAEVSVNDASDEDRVRYGLSGEAGLNDGAAFPFVVLALGLIEHGGAGGWLAGWAAHRLVWAVVAGLAVGYALGKGVGWVAIRLRSVQRDSDAPTDFLALALVALAYVAAEAISAWGFLAVFAAGLGLRSAEVHVVQRSPHPEAPAAEHHPPAEELVGGRVDPDALREPAVAAGAVVAETLSFGDTVERLAEVLLVLLVGVALANHWDPRGLVVAGVLFVIVRPLATAAALVGTDATRWQRFLMGWFGIRGIGSLYYVTYGMSHGLASDEGATAAGIVITAVAASIVAHGVSAQPLLDRAKRDAVS
jgi:NhaP-type Na+/H+ or K+/H+ antiporter